MDRKLTVFYTSDIHGCFAPVDYARSSFAPSGLANCAANFENDGNTLILDGGDTIQGSPFTYWLYSRTEERSLLPAKLMNLAGFQFVTLGNHDFNYGTAELERFLAALDAKCLCANVEGLRYAEKTAVVTLRNGLRVGLTGVTTQDIPLWEKPENIAGLRFRDAFETARDMLAELKRQGADVTICIYHGGFECDLDSGARLTAKKENQGYRMCRELDFDLLLTGHQHMPFADRCICGTHSCQPPDKARQYIRVDAAVDGEGRFSANSRLLPAGSRTPAAFSELLEEPEKKLAAFLDTPLGHLDSPLPSADPLDRALHGSLIANFFNQVQHDASGADLSATCLSNSVPGFPENVTLRDIVSNYEFPNTLRTIRVDREIIKKALERSAAYFCLGEDGAPHVSREFLVPVVQHFNFDYLSGIEATVDLRRPVGERVSSMLWHGGELPEDQTLTLCLNNYRASGAGGYAFYADCETVSELPDEISELIIRYVDRNRYIAVDRRQWLHVIY